MFKFNTKRFSLAAGLGVAAMTLGSFTSTTFAGSFQINEQSVSSMGTAYAGAAASAEDASTLFFNPAGMTLLPTAEVQIAGNYIIPHADFSDDHSVLVTPGGFIPIPGTNGGDNAGRAKVIPNIYYVQPFLKNFAFGLGVTTPFGLVTQYDNEFVGRYSALRSKLYTFDISPSLAVRLWNCLSIGAGFDAQRIGATLSQSIDFGSIGTVLGIPGYFPFTNDGLLVLKGHDWSYGFNTGAILEYLPQGTSIPLWGPINLNDGRIGFDYRSAIDQNLTGNASFSHIRFPFNTFLNSQRVEATIKLPDTYRLSLYQGFLDRWAIVGDVAFTHWSRLNSIVIHLPELDDSPSPLASLFRNEVLDLNYRDAWRYAGGLIFTPIDPLTWRFGMAYDETPIRSETHRTPRIPDSYRTYVATGFTYSITRKLDFDFAFMHLFVDKSRVNTLDETGHNLRGTFDSNANVVSAALTYKFGSPETPFEPKEGPIYQN